MVGVFRSIASFDTLELIKDLRKQFRVTYTYVIPVLYGCIAKLRGSGSRRGSTPCALRLLVSRLQSLTYCFRGRLQEPKTYIRGCIRQPSAKLSCTRCQSQTSVETAPCFRQFAICDIDFAGNLLSGNSSGDARELRTACQGRI